MRRCQSRLVFAHRRINESNETSKIRVFSRRENRAVSRLHRPRIDSRVRKVIGKRNVEREKEREREREREKRGGEKGREKSFTSCSLSTEGGCKMWEVHTLRVVEGRGTCYVREGLQT